MTFGFIEDPFGRTKVDYTVTFAFMEGFSNGLNWPDKWETHGAPGGPTVWTTGFNPDPAWKAKCKLSSQVNDAWRQGWRFGHHCKLNKINPISNPFQDRNL